MMLYVFVSHLHLSLTHTLTEQVFVCSTMRSQAQRFIDPALPPLPTRFNKHVPIKEHEKESMMQ